jgi:hypothetical protein
VAVNPLLPFRWLMIGKLRVRSRAPLLAASFITAISNAKGRAEARPFLFKAVFMQSESYSHARAL